MAVQDMKYCEYFDVDEKYFPCIDESAINSGAAWDTTYPHETFINLLSMTEKKRSKEEKPVQQKNPGRKSGPAWMIAA